MDFNDFCENNRDNNFNFKKQKFEKFNQNMQKNSKISEKIAKNEEFLSNFKKNSNIEIEKDLEEKIDKYKNMNSSELLKELMIETSRQKQSGTLDDSRIEEIKNSLLPFLSDEEKQKLENVIKIIR